MVDTDILPFLRVISSKVDLLNNLSLRQDILLFLLFLENNPSCNYCLSRQILCEVSRYHLSACDSIGLFALVVQHLSLWNRTFVFPVLCFFTLRERGYLSSESSWFQVDGNRLVSMAGVTVPVRNPVTVSPSATDLAHHYSKWMLLLFCVLFQHILVAHCCVHAFHPIMLVDARACNLPFALY